MYVLVYAFLNMCVCMHVCMNAFCAWHDCMHVCMHVHADACAMILNHRLSDLAIVWLSSLKEFLKANNISLYNYNTKTSYLRASFFEGPKVVTLRVVIPLQPGYGVVFFQKMAYIRVNFLIHTDTFLLCRTKTQTGHPQEVTLGNMQNFRGYCLCIFD